MDQNEKLDLKRELVCWRYIYVYVDRKNKLILMNFNLRQSFQPLKQEKKKKKRNENHFI